MPCSGHQLSNTEEEVTEVADLLKNDFCPKLRERLTSGRFQPTDASSWDQVETTTGKHFQVSSTGTPVRNNQQSEALYKDGEVLLGPKTFEDLLIQAEVKRTK